MTLFNVVVDNVVRTCMDITAKHQAVAQEVLRFNVGIFLVFFYADNGMIVEWDSEWLQNALRVLIGFFRRYGLVINIAKSRMIACQTGALRLVISE